MTDIIQWIESNPFISTVIFVVFTYVVDISPIKVNPWKFIWKNFGKAINGEVIQKLDNLENDLSEVKKRQDQQEYMRKRDNTDSARTRIIRAADEIRLGTHHSKEFFDEVLLDCNRYQEYCRVHDEYKNEKAVMSIQIIEETYQKCMRENSFL